MTSDTLVTLQVQNGIARVSLNRPARHNALIPELLNQALRVFAHKNCQNARVVILRAEGQSFSTGGDLLGFQQHRKTIGTYANRLVGLLNEVILAIYSHPSPVICAVQGQVTGGSLGLLLAADRTILHRSVCITPYYSMVGFSPDGGWTALLPETIGRQQALSWLASNASHDAESCVAMGIAQQVVEDNCDTAALEWAERLCKMQSNSIKQSRRLINASTASLRNRLEAERRAFVVQVQTAQALNGIDHFLRRNKHA